MVKESNVYLDIMNILWQKLPKQLSVFCGVVHAGTPGNKGQTPELPLFPRDPNSGNLLGGIIALGNGIAKNTGELTGANKKKRKKQRERRRLLAEIEDLAKQAEATADEINEGIRVITHEGKILIKKLSRSCPFECRIVNKGSPFKQSQVLIKGKVIQIFDEIEVLVDIGFPIVVQKENDVDLELGDWVEVLGFGIVDPPIAPIYEG